MGGFQAGYNWQTGKYLIGIETDLQISGQKGDQAFSVAYPTGATAFGNPMFGTLSSAYTEKLNWLGTLRGRIGFTPAERLLVYATGGLAYGRVTIAGSSTATGTDAAIPGAGTCVGLNVVQYGQCSLASFSNSATKAGWTLGFGAEGAITGSWSWKVEYLHVDLGSISTAFATRPGCFGATASSGGFTVGACNIFLAGSGTVSSRITDEIVRVGINYKFN